MASPSDIPKYSELIWPTLQAVKGLGGSARIDEISESVIEVEGFTEEQQQVPRRPDDNMTMIDYRLAWSRNYLKNIGALENSARGVWAITEMGNELGEDEIPDLIRKWKREYYQQRKLQQAIDTDLEDPDETDDSDDWHEVLIARLLQMEPDAFERLSQRLLREAGFRNVEVLGRTGDGGLDGVGVYRVSLVGFPVYFQCKRYKGSVQSSSVRDFRGAMSGRGEKGLLITTGTFTKGAREEATRDGAPPVELVSGDDLCDLLMEYQLGVSVKTIQVPQVDTKFFDQF